MILRTEIETENCSNMIISTQVFGNGKLHERMCTIAKSIFNG